MRQHSPREHLTSAGWT